MLAPHPITENTKGACCRLADSFKSSAGKKIALSGFIIQVKPLKTSNWLAGAFLALFIRISFSPVLEKKKKNVLWISDWTKSTEYPENTKSSYITITLHVKMVLMRDSCFKIALQYFHRMPLSVSSATKLRFYAYMKHFIIQIYFYLIWDVFEICFI